MTLPVCAGAGRVISLSPAMTELICHLGKEDLLVGRSDVCDFPESVKKLPVAGNFAKPFLEKIISLKADLLITNDLINPGVAENLQRFGIRTLMLPCRNLDEYRKCVQILGRELQCASRAETEIARIDAFRRAVPEKLNLNVLWVIWDAPLMTPGKKSHLNEVITVAGAENVTGKVNADYLRPSFDDLLRRKIDVVIWSASGKKWKQRRVWQKFQAVRKNRVVDNIDQSVLLRPGPRMFEGIERLKGVLRQWKRP